MSTTTARHASPAISDTATPIVEAQGLVKRYRDTVAVNGIDLTVWPGEIFGLLGPNGAGKTTTLEMVEGLRTPDAGSIRVAGIDAVADPLAVRRVIGVQLQTTALFDYLSAAEIVSLFSDLYEVDASPARVDELLDLVGLGEKRAARVDQLSGGQQQRLSIALALVNSPAVAFLDEPTTGLDPQARRNLWQTIRDVRAAGTTIVMTTHYMEEAETLCDRVAIIDRGQLIALGSPASLVRQLDMAATVRATVSGGRLPRESLTRLPSAVDVAYDEASGPDEAMQLVVRTTDAQATLVALLDLAELNGVTLAGLSSTQANLEDVFLNIAGRSYEAGDNPPPADAPPSRRRR